MTFKQKFHSELDWRKRIVILHLFHLTMQNRNKKWQIKHTAKRIGISSSTASENLLLAEYYELIKECPSRNQALKLVHYMRIEK